MNTIVVGGGSAGGQLVGQYVNIQTNSEYATEMGMIASIKKEDIKAVVFNSALLDSTRFDKTGNFIINRLFGALGRLYFDTDNLRKSTEVEQSNVISHLISDFPPSFITDGNHGTFTDQAIDLDKRMTELAIPHVFNYYDVSEAKLGHGYESSLDNEYAKKNFAQMLAFLNQQLGEQALHN
jgi:acetyl esterase/lipase